MKQHFSYSYLLKKNVDTRTKDIIIKLIVYPITIPLAWILLNFTSISANALTIFGLISGMLGSFLSFITLDLKYVLIGFIIFYICDFVDGRVASAKGGGTYFGAFLDLLTDRTVFLASMMALVYYHFRMDQSYYMLLSFIYIIFFEYLEVVGYATMSSKYKYNKMEKFVSDFKENTLANNFLLPTVWFPSRLSSYLVGIIAYFLTSSFQIAYVAAIIAVGFDYFRFVLDSAFVRKILKINY